MMSVTEASPNSPSDKLKEALVCAGRGWNVFPVYEAQPGGKCSCRRLKCEEPGKHPRTRRGFKDATMDAAQLREWWTRDPSANVAIRTGAPSGIVVVDIDPRNRGHVNLAALEAEHGVLPPTVQCLTGGAGLHYYFRHLGFKVTKKSLVPGVDIKGDGGYVIAPPSNHTSGGTYRWHPDFHPNLIPMADAPDWLIAKLRPSTDENECSTEPTSPDGALPTGEKRSGSSTTKITASQARLGASDGERHKAMMVLVQSCMGKRWPKTKTRKEVLQAARCCLPPLPQEDALDIVNWCYRTLKLGSAPLDAEGTLNSYKKGSTRGFMKDIVKKGRLDWYGQSRKGSRCYQTFVGIIRQLQIFAGKEPIAIPQTRFGSELNCSTRNIGKLIDKALTEGCLSLVDSYFCPNKTARLYRFTGPLGTSMEEDEEVTEAA